MQLCLFKDFWKLKFVHNMTTCSQDSLVICVWKSLLLNNTRQLGANLTNLNFPSVRHLVTHSAHVTSGTDETCGNIPNPVTDTSATLTEQCNLMDHSGI